jgi:hypothetical protein
VKNELPIIKDERKTIILSGLVWNSAEVLMSEIVGESRPTHIIMCREESQQSLYSPVK